MVSAELDVSLYISMTYVKKVWHRSCYSKRCAKCRGKGKKVLSKSLDNIIWIFLLQAKECLV